MYADMDNDGKLSLDEYSIIHGMINEVPPLRPRSAARRARRLVRSRGVFFPG